MGQAKARGTREQRVKEATSAPPKARKMSNREINEAALKAAMGYVSEVFAKMSR
jgi:hypothetical protein